MTKLNDSVDLWINDFNSSDLMSDLLAEALVKLSHTDFYCALDMLKIWSMWFNGERQELSPRCFDMFHPQGYKHTKAN